MKLSAIIDIFKGTHRNFITPCSPAASAVLLTTHSMEEAEAGHAGHCSDVENQMIWQFDCTRLVVTGGCFRSLCKYKSRFTLPRHNKKPKIDSIDTSWSIKSVLNVTSVAMSRDVEGFVQPPWHHGQWPTFDSAVARFCGLLSKLRWLLQLQMILTYLNCLVDLFVTLLSISRGRNCAADQSEAWKLPRADVATASRDRGAARVEQVEVRYKDQLKVSKQSQMTCSDAHAEVC